MMKAPPKPDVPIITVDQLAEADGIIFGFGTRFGMVPAQMKSLWDATGQLWYNRQLEGKFVGTFFSTGSQHGVRLYIIDAIGFNAQAKRVYDLLYRVKKPLLIVLCLSLLIMA